MEAETMNLIVAVLALVVSIYAVWFGYKADENNRNLGSDEMELSIIKDLYEAIEEQLTVPMSRSDWVAIRDCVLSIEQSATMFKSEDTKPRYERMRFAFARKYYKRIFSLPDTAYIDGQYDPMSTSHKPTERVPELLKNRFATGRLVPIADESIMYTLWLHFRYDEDTIKQFRKPAYTKLEWMRENEMLRDEWEAATRNMIATHSESGGAYSGSGNFHERNGYAIVHAVFKPGSTETDYEKALRDY